MAYLFAYNRAGTRLLHWEYRRVRDLIETISPKKMPH
jgi:hypothetical protein